jgi:hypothetical protein
MTGSDQRALRDVRAPRDLHCLRDLRDPQDRRERASSTGASASAAVVLDIGGEVGALVVHLATRPTSGELEACPAGEPDARFHTGVHLRPLGYGVAWTAVFPEVEAGTYYLLDPQGHPMAQVTVPGAQVHHLDLR